MTHLILTLLSLFTSPCDAYADGLLIDYDDRSGIIVIDADTGAELDGTICVEPSATYETTSSNIVLLIDQAPQTEGPIVAEGDMCVSVDGVNRCACTDQNGVEWTQQCSQGIPCHHCCSNFGGTANRIKIKIGPPWVGE